MGLNTRLLELEKAIILGTINSTIRLHTDNGVGSGSTAIRRFTTTVLNVGTAISFVDSAEFAATFTINEVGLYTISYTFNWDGAQIGGVSLNSSELTTNLTSIATADLLIWSQTGGTNQGASSTWTGVLQVGDIVRAHSSTSDVGGGNPTVFTIAKIGPRSLLLKV